MKSCANWLPGCAAALAVMVVALGLGSFESVRGAPAEKGQTAVFELRTYTAPEGKLDELHARFRDHTLRLFEKHGMKNIVYLSPTDEKLAGNTLVYLLGHESREAADKSWAAFRADPEWIKARDASEKNGKLVDKVVSEYFTATDYSPLKGLAPPSAAGR